MPRRIQPESSSDDEDADLTLISSKFLTRQSAFGLRVGTCEMQGWRPEMEDAMTVRLGFPPRFPQHCFAGVYDGHCGTQASSYLQTHLADRVMSLYDPTDPETLKACLRKLDRDFFHSTNELGKESGSTCVFAVFWPMFDGCVESEGGVSEWDVIVGNVGDSRAMIIRANGQVVNLSTDHKPDVFIESRRILDAGGTIGDNRVEGELAMSRSIGDFCYKNDSNLSPDLQKVIPVPDLQTATIYGGDYLFLCCDGIVEEMDNKDAAAVITTEVGHLRTFNLLYSPIFIMPLEISPTV